MSSFNSAKKLLTVKKAWKSFTNTLRSRFHKLEIPKHIKKTTSHFIPFSILRKEKSSTRVSRHYMIQKESSSNSIIRPYTTKGSSYHHHHIHHQHNMEKNFAAIFVDELFAEPTNYTYGEEPSKGKEVGSSSSSQSSNKATSMDVQKHKYHVQPAKKEDVANMAVQGKKNDSETRTSATAWEELRNTCKSLPQVRGVDERAEEFISKFRQDMKLEREKSIIDYQEMLARSV